MHYCQEDFSDFCSCSLVWFKYKPVTPPNAAAASRQAASVGAPPPPDANTRRAAAGKMTSA